MCDAVEIDDEGRPVCRRCGRPSEAIYLVCPKAVCPRCHATLWDSHVEVIQGLRNAFCRLRLLKSEVGGQKSET